MTTPEVTPAVRRAGEAIEDAAFRFVGRDLGTIYRDRIAREGLAAEEMARDLLLEFDDYRCGDHLDEPWNYDTEEPCQDCAKAQADKAMSVVRVVRAAILGADQ